ncbi:MAG: hypothetical protein OEV55_08665 [candidate division Zixibacteria bacterium]|nr:hypothetical protein [candidate division Zixibacteria bacterium]
MKRWIIIFTLSLLLVVLIGSNAFATLARIYSLGNADYFYKDIYQIYRNPAWLGSYTNTVYGELGWYYTWMDEYEAPYDQALGINYKIYKGLSLGLTLNRYVDWDADVFYHFWWIDGYGYFPEPINGYDLMASYDFEKLHLGIGFYHAGNKATVLQEASIDDTTTGDEFGQSVKWEGELTSGITSLTGGFVYDVDENKCIEGMFTLSFDRAKSHFNQTYTYYSDFWGDSYVENWEETFKIDGGNRMEFGARAFWEVAENFQIVPLVTFGTESLKLDSTVSYSYNYDPGTIWDEAWDTSGTTGDVKQNYLIIALGGNLKLDKGMVAGGLSLYREKWTDETESEYTYEYTSTLMPGFNLGVEYELTRWLTARVGMEKWFGRDEEKYDQDYWEPPYHYLGHTKYTDRYSEYPDDFIGVGFGFKFSKFKVDAFMGEQNLFRGGYILSGQENNMFANISAIFEF